MKRGFTLIELLVVVAIIGLLASVIILNTTSTRMQAHDAQIQTSMHQLRNAADLSYSQGPENYSAICDESDDTLSNTGEFDTLEKSIMHENGNQNVSCFESINKMSFAASSPLRSEPGKSWCVESAAFSVQLDCLTINTSTCQCQ